MEECNIIKSNDQTKYEMVNGRAYRIGYSTGSCATAASKAAVLMLLGEKKVDKIQIRIPSGDLITLPIQDVEITKAYAKCAVVKDGGDDPDVTSGLKIFAKASSIYEMGEERVVISTGEGIGIVTLAGLKVGIGQPAINPIPRNMIVSEVSQILPKDRRIHLELSIPNGEEIAKKTYNPKLGVVGGLSILGTTGLVRPMSEEAWKDSLALELNIMRAKGLKSAVFTFGNIGEGFSKNALFIDKEYIITISNFVGFMLDKAVEKGFESIVLVGHLGKIVKVAAGNFHTHSRVSDARMETLGVYASIEGASRGIVEEIMSCKTTDAAASIIEENGLTRVYERIAETAANKCKEYTYNKISCGVVLFNEMDSLLSMTKVAEEIVTNIRRSYG